MSYITETKSSREIYAALDFDMEYYVDFLKNEFNLPRVLTTNRSERPDIPTPYYPEVMVSTKEAEQILTRIKLNYGLYSQFYKKETKNHD